MAKSAIEKIYLLETEESGDSFFSPSGVVMIGERQRILLYCQNGVYNLYKSAITRNEWSDLERGITYRSVGFRLTDITSEMQERGWQDTSSIPDVLQSMQERFPRHLYFLAALAST